MSGDPLASRAAQILLVLKELGLVDLANAVNELLRDRDAARAEVERLKADKERAPDMWAALGKNGNIVGVTMHRPAGAGTYIPLYRRADD